MAKSVRIENPIPGGAKRTSVRRAQHFVRNGRAIFVSDMRIKFINVEAQAALIQRSEELALDRLRGRTTGFNYDRVPRNFYLNARRIPILMPEKMRA
jgi:hypothetical protein